MTTLANIKYNPYFFVHVLILDSYILVRTSYCIKASLVFGSSHIPRQRQNKIKVEFLRDRNPRDLAVRSVAH